MGAPLERIWPFYGYDEVNYTTTPSGEALLQALAKMHTAPVHLRTHFLLNSGDGTASLKWGSTNVYTEDANGAAVSDLGLHLPRRSRRGRGVTCSPHRQGAARLRHERRGDAPPRRRDARGRLHGLDVAGQARHAEHDTGPAAQRRDAARPRASAHRR